MSVAEMQEKWGDAAAAGFTQVPNHLVAINQFRPKDQRLTPTEFLVLMQLLMSWWRAERFPFPSKATLAERTGLSERQIQRTLTSLEKHGFLKREALNPGHRGTNQYNLSGLVEAVQKAAHQEPDAFRKKRASKTQKGPAPSEGGAF